MRAGWRKKMEGDGVFQSDGGVNNVRWDVKKIAGVKNYFFPVYFKFQRALENVGDLLILVVMRRHHASFFQQELG
jgi:hypothetical protein